MLLIEIVNYFIEFFNNYFTIKYHGLNFSEVLDIENNYNEEDVATEH